MFWISFTLTTILAYASSSTSSSVPCPLPKTINRRHTIYCGRNNSNHIIAGAVPTSCKIFITCATGFAITETSQGSSSTCHQGHWYPQIRECRKICRKWKPANLDLTCFNKNKTEISCMLPLLSGATIKQRCAEQFRLKTPVDYDEIVCDEHGNWDRPLYMCTPVCGKTFSKPIPQISLGGNETYGKSPWHVAIYNSAKILICGGTIISPRVVLSAAHCFFNSEESVPLNASSFEVAVSKVTRNYRTKDNQFQRFYKVKNYYYPQRYFGLKTNYGGDIALAFLAEEIEMSSAVLPACLELSNSIFNLTDHTVGKVSGWGNDNHDKPSEVLLTANLSYTSYEQCVEQFPIDERDAITLDKFCAGGTKDDEPAVQRGDSGGGFILFDPNTKSNYVLGVVSVKIGNKALGLFSSIQSYTQFIKTTLVQLNQSTEAQYTSELAKSCLLPTKENYQEYSVKCDSSSNKTEDIYAAEFCTISLQCNNSAKGVWNINSNPKFQSTCIDGNWSPQLPICQTTIRECTTPDNLSGFCSSSVGCPWYRNSTNSTQEPPSTECKAKSSNINSDNYCCLRCGKLSNDANPADNTTGAWPWLVSVRYKDHNDTLHMGTLISDRWVITNSVYIGTRQIEYILAGGLSKDKSTATDTTQHIPVASVHVHRTYITIRIVASQDSVTAYNLALIRLLYPVTLGRNVLPICLLDEYKTNEFYEGKQAYVAGWGSSLTENAEAPINPALLPAYYQSSTYITDHKKCAEFYHKQKYHYQERTEDTDDALICAANNSSEICKDAKGAPLVMQLEGTYYLIGVANFGAGCEQKERQNVYTKVHYFLDWIYEEISAPQNF